ncbi:MAG: VOC family protein [Acidobacteriota bacterium]
MPDNQVDYIEFPATDIAATKTFYEAVFAWKFEDFGPAYTSFQDGRMQGGFTTGEKGPAKWPLIVIYADDLEAALERVKTAKGNIVKPIYPFPGGRRFHFEDPNGNELAVWSK